MILAALPNQFSARLNSTFGKMRLKCISGAKDLQTSISEASVDVDQELLLDRFETAIAAGHEDTARQALREYFFAAQGLPCEGSFADAIEPMTQHPADDPHAVRDGKEFVR